MSQLVWDAAWHGDSFLQSLKDDSTVEPRRRTPDSWQRDLSNPEEGVGNWRVPHRQPFLWETLSVPPEEVLTASPSAPLKWPLLLSWLLSICFHAPHPSTPPQLFTVSSGKQNSLFCALYICQQKWRTQQALLTPKQLGLFLLFLWPKFPGESKLFQEVLTATRSKEHFKDTQKLSRGDWTSPQQARRL